MVVAGAAVRVRPELLDRLVNQAGEVMTTRARMESELVTLRGSLKDLTGNLDRLRGQLRDIELQAETQMQMAIDQNRQQWEARQKDQELRQTAELEAMRAQYEDAQQLMADLYAGNCQSPKHDRARSIC